MEKEIDKKGEREREKRREERRREERGMDHSLILSPKAHNSQGWVKLK